MTALRYRIPTTKEIVAMWMSVPRPPDAGAEYFIRIAADAKPAEAEATRYFQTVAITEVMPTSIGFPAYQKAGIASIQKDAVQATATPTGPHGSPRMNSSPVTANSTSPQRNQRSGLPMER